MKQNQKPYGALDRSNDLIKQAETFLMASCTLALVLVIFIEVVCRYMLFISTAWAEELSRYLFIWLTYIGSAYAIDEGGHIEIDVCKQLVEKIADENRREKLLSALEAAAMLTTCAFLIVFGKIFWDYMMKIWSTTQTSPTMHIPMGYIYLPVFIGTVMGIFHCFYNLYRQAFKLPAAE
ncbi:MAG: TRAP transporter small permease [Anaerotruncus sp.]|nr:TRAP transporter small permease [Anaerotruncus sp.]